MQIKQTRKSCTKALLTIFLIPLIALVSTDLTAQAQEFDMMVVPSLTDQKLDGWYKIPPNSGPRIHKASKVTQGQSFNLFVFFNGYSSDKTNNINIRYDFQIFGPAGTPTADKGSDLVAYQSPGGESKNLILSQQFVKIILTDKYPVGTYKIKVTAHDKVAGKSISTETPIELQSFSLPSPFSSQKEAEMWMMGYYNNPEPIKAIRAVQQLVNTKPEWLKKHKNAITYFQRIFIDNPFVLQNISNTFDSFSLEDKKKLLLIAAKVDGASIIDITNDPQLVEYFNHAKAIKLPDVSGQINSADQLDILWSEFLATGRYEPINKIISALSLGKHKGTLEKIKSGKIKNITDKIRQEAYLEATYQSAVWSLISNCSQMPLVFKYCVFIYEHEKLTDDVKGQLGFILHTAQKRIQERGVNKKSNS